MSTSKMISSFSSRKPPIADCGIEPLSFSGKKKPSLCLVIVSCIFLFIVLFLTFLLFKMAILSLIYPKVQTPELEKPEHECTVDNCQRVAVFRIIFLHLLPTKQATASVLTSDQKGRRLASENVVFSSRVNSSKPFTIQLNRTQKFQTVLGFGGEFSKSTRISVARLSKDLQRKLIQDLYGEDGLELKFSLIEFDRSKKQKEFSRKLPYLESIQLESQDTVRFVADPPSYKEWNNDGFFSDLFSWNDRSKEYGQYISGLLNISTSNNVSLWAIADSEKFQSAKFLHSYLIPFLPQDLKNVKIMSINQDRLIEKVINITEVKTNLEDGFFHRFEFEDAFKEFRGFFTEFPFFKQTPTDWDIFSRFSLKIMRGLNQAGRGWIFANLVQDSGSSDDEVAIRVSNAGDKYYKLPTFYAMAHFSQFLPEGSIRIGNNVTNAVANVELNTFSLPSGQTVAILLNQNNNDINVTVVDKSGYLNLISKANSLQTIIW